MYAVVNFAVNLSKHVWNWSKLVKTCLNWSKHVKIDLTFSKLVYIYLCSKHWTESTSIVDYLGTHTSQDIIIAYISRFQTAKPENRNKSPTLKMYAIVNFAVNLEIKVKVVDFCTFVIMNGFMWIVLCGLQKSTKRLMGLCKMLARPWHEAWN